MEAICASTIQEIIAGWARRTPRAIALLARGRPPLRYGRLQELVSGLGQALRAQGLNRADRVAVVLPAGPEMAVTFLGVACAAVCAPLNPACTRRELEAYLTLLGAKAAVVPPGDSWACEAASALNLRVLRLSPALEDAAGTFTLDTGVEPGRAELEPCRSEDVALVLHTSGTTGRPKVVPLTHRNLCASARNIRGALRLSEADRCLNVMPLFHIHGLAGALLSSLAAGGSVACPGGFSAPDFFSWLGEFHPTWYTAVPTMHQAILAREERHPGAAAEHPLRFIRSSSAALAPAVMAGLEAVFHAPVIESYGMTEAAHQMASNPLPPGVRKPGSVGLPAGPEIAIMDEAGNLLAAGETGEIVIRGENVTRGYENHPEANEQSFTHGWFRTGDQGFLDGDGYLFVSGRLKEMINRGGEKISPREVDEALLQHPAVSQAVCFAIPHRQLGEAVGAAVVLKPRSTATALELRQFVSERLAAFKVPQVLTLVSEIPRGATGKIQRIGLADKLGFEPIDDTDARKEAEYLAPRTPLEIQLAGIWCEILRIDKVGVYDNFFFLGGDSLAATVLMTRLSEQVGAEVSFLRFLDSPTIATLASEISRLPQPPESAQARPPRLVPIQPHGARPPLFCATGHGGNLTLFCGLARYLEPDQPVFGFPPPRLEGGQVSYRLEDLAAQYVESLRAFQPEGPYQLAGICHGGFIVFEMARQLHRQGLPVDLLAMLDCYYPRGARDLPWTCLLARGIRLLRARLRFHRRALGARAIREWIPYLADRAREAARETGFKAGQAVYSLLVTARLPLPGCLRQPRYANAYALRKYVPGSYPGGALLLRVRDLHPEAPEMGWKGLIGGEVEILDSPYHHRGVLAEATLQVMARQLQARLDRVAARHERWGAAAREGG